MQPARPGGWPAATGAHMVRREAGLGRADHLHSFFSSLLFSPLGLNRGICSPSLSSKKTSWRFHLRETKSIVSNQRNRGKRQTWFKRKKAVVRNVLSFLNTILCSQYVNVLTFCSRLTLFNQQHRQGKFYQWMAGTREEQQPAPPRFLIPPTSSSGLEAGQLLH